LGSGSEFIVVQNTTERLMNRTEVVVPSTRKAANGIF